MATSASTIRRHEAIHSKGLGADRGVTVYLPPGYQAEAGQRYPVLLLHDGQNLFDPARAHIVGETWRVAETADRLILSGRIDPLVIVGIDHGGTARVAEFTPTPGPRADGGQANRYARFVIDEVIPLVARRYSVRTDADGIGLGGSSLGALVTLVIASNDPGRFGRLLLMSPSVWWDKRVILEIARGLTDSPGLPRPPLERGSLAGEPPSPRVWLDVGLKEGAQAVRNARRLREVLLSAGGAGPAGGAGRRDRMRYVEDPDGDHSERSWARRFGAALQFLYGADSPTS